MLGKSSPHTHTTEKLLPKSKKVLILLQAYREFVVTPSQKRQTKKTENGRKKCKASSFNVITSSSIN
jgi:hypothetical protein